MSKLDLAIYMGYRYDPTHPSVRLRRLNLRKPLRKAGIHADLIFRYEDLAPYKNILISHFDQEVALQIKNLKAQGKRIFYCHTENLWGFEYQEEVFNLCDYIVCCSTKLAQLTQSRLTSPYTKCVVIPDMAEGPAPKHIPAEREKLTVVWVGMGGNSYLAKDLKPIIESVGMQLVVISEHADADIPWTRENYLDNMSRCDIAICPQNVELQPAKSNVKVVTAMSVGLPVICSPNPAYLEIVEHGVNGYVATTPDEWRQALLDLKDFSQRKKISEAALQTSIDFSPEAIAKYWVKLLKSDKRPTVALINNTLPIKYLSYGDYILESLRFSGIDVHEYRYEDIDELPATGIDMYLFIEVRYDPENISDVHPKVLYTREDIDLNCLPHFDCIVSTNPQLVDKWHKRGFVNVFSLETENFNLNTYKQLISAAKTDRIELRKQHNKKLHSDHINMFHSLQPPEERWSGGNRDRIHIAYTKQQIYYYKEKEPDKQISILDIGSADGWMALLLAAEGHDVAGLEFVKRGMEWTKQNADRLGVRVDLRYGFIEEAHQVFNDRLFDIVLAYEILEHLDYQKIPWYLSILESCLKPGGKVLVSLPKQDLNYNPEHLWTPSKKLIDKAFANKFELVVEWVDIPNHEIPGNWFISYSNKLTF